MTAKFTLEVSEGIASKGKTFRMSEDTLTLGGQASDSDIIISDLPSGVSYLRFKWNNDQYAVEELEDRSCRIDDRPFRLNEVLKVGSVLSLPNKSGDESVQLKVLKHRSKGKHLGIGFAFAGDNKGFPLKFILVGLIIVGLWGGILFYLFSDQQIPQRRTVAPLTLQQIETDVASGLEIVEPSAIPSVAETPKTMRQLANLVIASPNNQTQEELIKSYSATVLALLAEADRLIVTGQRSKARDIYQQAFDMLDIPTLKSYRYVLTQIQDL